jgi:hypothetical protein
MDNTALTEILNFNVQDSFDRPERKIITSSGKNVSTMLKVDTTSYGLNNKISIPL